MLKAAPAMTVRMVNNPTSLDTIVGTNLHMDILSDLAAALAGSIGVAPSSNLDPTRKNPFSSSQSMAVPLISLGRVLQTLLLHSGLLPRCSIGWGKRRLLRS
jgi:hypothetical protein